MARAPLERQRVAQIYVPHVPASTRNVGSGYLVGGRLVLTARHVVGGEGTRCRVRFLAASDSVETTMLAHDAAVVWASDPDTGLDAALLELDAAQAPDGGALVAFG